MLKEEDEKVNDNDSPIKNYPTSIKSKLVIKLNLQKILEEMNTYYPLSSLAEDIDYETKGNFSFLDFKEIISKKYPELNIDKKIFLFKYIPLTSIGVSQKTPYITLLNLFKYFEKILEKKIISPSLIFYKTAENLEKKIRTSPLEFFYSIGLYTSSIINLEEFYIKISKKLNLDDIDCIVIFKSLDYKNCGKIKINDFIVVLNSYSNDVYINKNNLVGNTGLKDEEKNAKILKMFLDKNSINLDKIFDNENTNFLEYNFLKSILMKEISNNQNNFKIKEPINEKIVDSVLTSVSRNYKIFKDDLNNFINNSKLDIIHNYIKLNDIQKFWIKRYIKILESINITPKMLFESAAPKKSPNIINLEDLKRQLNILLPYGKITVPELNNMMDALNINKNMTIERPQYNQIIKQIKKEINHDNENINKEKNDFIKNNNNKDIIGVKSTFYHLLPIKGNIDVLRSLNKDLNENFLIPKKFEENEDENEIDNRMPFKEEKILSGDKAINKEEESKYDIKKESIKDNKEIKGEYIDQHKLIEIFENFKYHKILLTSYDFLSYLIINNISKEKSYEIMKYIDTDEDGYISILQIMNFILKVLKHRSTKMLYKYLYLKIYQDFGFPSSEEFFTRYNFSIYDVININDLAKFYLALDIELPLIMKSYEELRNIFKPPLIYKNICKLIDQYRNDDKINNFYNKEEKNELKYTMSPQQFDTEIKNFIYNFLDKNEIIKDNNIKATLLRQKLNSILKNCVDKMNLSQYNLFFVKPLNMENLLAMNIFQILKIIMPNDEQLIDKNDLIMLLESYACSNELKIKLQLTQKNNKNEELVKLVEYIENNYPPFKYAFEIIPFRRSGIISSSELIIYLENFYKNIPKNYLMKIVKNLDIDKIGYITYSQIQMFLYNYSYVEKFSINIELKLIASNISKTDVLNGDEYFMKDEFKGIIKRYQKIGKKEHNEIFNNLCSSNKNKAELFNYLIKNSGTQKYDLKYITDIIDGFLELDYYKKPKKTIKIDERDLIEKLPKKEVFEKAIQNINLGDNGFIFMNQILKQIPVDCQKTIKKKFDIDNKGYILYPEFIKICRNIYGTKINLNYKLCAQYLYKCYIKSPELIQSFLLNRVKETNIKAYLTYDVVYNNFMFAFVNDKFLFNDFYTIYKEKEEQYRNMLKLHSLHQFILYNNPELKSYPKIEYKKPNKEEIKSNDDQYGYIHGLINKKLITIRELIEMINISECDLKSDFSINEEYIRSLLNKNFDYINEEIDALCNYFRSGNNRFNLQKLFCFDIETKNNLNIIIYEEIIPKIKEEIIYCGINNYRQYKIKNFNKTDYLTITEASDIFYNLYNLTLFHCLCLINDYQFLFVDKLFEEYELKDLFKEKEYEPVLKTAIIKLNNYFETHKDKLKLFKEIDLDKNGYLSKEEFITLLNSLEDLNLEDNQKIKLLKIADKNKDGKINSKEFLNFIKSAKYLSDKNTVDEMKSTFPIINKKIAINNTTFTERFLEDKSLVEKNLEINKNIFKGNNGFLNTIIILQEDIVNNFFNFDSIEQDFNIADGDKSGKVSYFKFESILKKRLYQLKENNFIEMIKFANDGLDEKIIEELNNEKVINYRNFLTNLVNYNEEGKMKREWEEDEIIIEKKEEKKEEIKIGNIPLEESNIEKEEEGKKEIKIGNMPLEGSNVGKEEEDINIGRIPIEESNIEKEEENIKENIGIIPIEESKEEKTEEIKIGNMPIEESKIKKDEEKKEEIKIGNIPIEESKIEKGDNIYENFLNDENMNPKEEKIKESEIVENGEQNEKSEHSNNNQIEDSKNEFVEKKADTEILENKNEETRRIANEENEETGNKENEIMDEI